jgi:zinc transporter 1/2/3
MALDMGSRTSPMVALVLEGLAAGTFIYVGATEIAVDEYETTAEECDDKHGAVAVKAVKDVEVAPAPGGAAAGTAHTHRVHAPPGRNARLAIFSAYLFGCLVVLLASLAPHAD